MTGFNPNKITFPQSEKIAAVPELDPQLLFRAAQEEAASVEIKPEDRNSEGELLVFSGGPKSNLSEGYWKLVRTPSFKQWFGDSNVVDEHGEPALLYHKTHADLETFNSFSKKDQVDPAHYFTGGDIKMGNNRLSVFVNAHVKKVDRFSEIHRFTDKTKDEVLHEGYEGVVYLASNANEELEKTKQEFKRNHAPETFTDYIFFGIGKLKGLVTGNQSAITKDSDYIQNKTEFLQTLKNPYYQLVVFDGKHIMVVNKEKAHVSV